MMEEAATAGFYESRGFPDRRFPKVQILTIQELLNGKELLYPRLATATFKKAQRKQKGSVEQRGIF
jgi:site-specific DNA-methyltransferase (adenine-specific)